MLKRAALAGLFIAVLAIGVTYVVTMITGAAPVWAPWVFAPAIGVSLLAVVVLSLGARAVDRRVAGALVFTFVVVVGGFLLALVLRADGEPLLLGLPRRAAIILYGVGLLPLLVLPLAYAATFGDSESMERDLSRLREAGARREPTAQAEPPGL